MRVWAPQKLYVNQLDAFLEQVDPESGTRYVVLAPTPNVRLKSIAVSLMWTAQPALLQAYVTLSIKEIIFVRTDPPTGTPLMAQLLDNKAPSDQIFGTISHLYNRGFMLEDRLATVDVVVIGGAVSLLQCRVKWAKC